MLNRNYFILLKINEVCQVLVESVQVQSSDATFNAATRLRWMPAQVLASPLDWSLKLIVLLLIALMQLQCDISSTKLNSMSSYQIKDNFFNQTGKNLYDVNTMYSILKLFRILKKDSRLNTLTVSLNIQSYKTSTDDVLLNLPRL